MGRQKTRTVLAWEQGSRDRHCSWHHQYTHLPFTLPLSPSFDLKCLLQPNSVTCGSGSIVAKARWVHLHLKGPKGNSERLLLCTIPPQSSLLPVKFQFRRRSYRRCTKYFRYPGSQSRVTTSPLTFRAPLSLQHPEQLYLQTPARAQGAQELQSHSTSGSLQQNVVFIWPWKNFKIFPGNAMIATACEESVTTPLQILSRHRRHELAAA